MKIMRVGPAGSERPAAVAGDGSLLDLSSVVGAGGDIDGRSSPATGRLERGTRSPPASFPYSIRRTCGSGRRWPGRRSWCASG